MDDEYSDDPHSEPHDDSSDSSSDGYPVMVEHDNAFMELEEFDRDLPSAHSYLPSGLVTIPGRSVLESGWVGRVLCWRHQSVVFPGETIPMVFGDLNDTELMQHMIQADRLFGLVFWDTDGSHTYGVLCEVVEATPPVDVSGQALFREPFSFKAKARQRFLLIEPPNVQIGLPERIDNCEIKILPDIILNDPLKNMRFSSLGRHRNAPKTRLNERIRRADSMITPWPQFVFDVFDEQKVVEQIRHYFKNMTFANLPNDNLSLSFWVATNLTLSNKDRLALFSTDNVLLRLYMELYHIRQKIRILCCVICMTEICDKTGVFAMSSEGIYSNYCNIGGYVHDIMTVKEVTNVSLQGSPSMKFTWFPGYAWTIAVCATCGSHVGWRFDAGKKNLVPKTFWGLGRRSLITERGNMFADHMN